MLNQTNTKKKASPYISSVTLAFWSSKWSKNLYNLCYVFSINLLTVLIEFPFKCKPLSKRGDEAPLLWSLDGPGEPGNQIMKDNCLY